MACYDMRAGVVRLSPYPKSPQPRRSEPVGLFLFGCAPPTVWPPPQGGHTARPDVLVKVKRALLGDKPSGGGRLATAVGAPHPPQHIPDRPLAAVAGRQVLGGQP